MNRNAKTPNNQFYPYASLLRTRLQVKLGQPEPSPMRLGIRIRHDCQCDLVIVSASEGNHTHSYELWAPCDPRSRGQRPARTGDVFHPFLQGESHSLLRRSVALGLRRSAPVYCVPREVRVPDKV